MTCKKDPRKDYNCMNFTRCWDIQWCTGCRKILCWVYQDYCLGITELLLMKKEVSAASACKLAAWTCDRSWSSCDGRCMYR